MRGSEPGPLPTLPDGLLDALGPTWPQLRDLVRPTTLVPVWATVDLDRAAASIPVASRSSPILDAPLLGARVRVIGLVEGAEPPEIVVAEPSTEGRLAAWLSRHGEGWSAVYLPAGAGAVARLREARAQLSAEAPGPYGPERLVLDGQRAGPFVLIASVASVGGASVAGGS
jgi:hypothetical protein